MHFANWCGFMSRLDTNICSAVFNRLEDIPQEPLSPSFHATIPTYFVTNPYFNIFCDRSYLDYGKIGLMLFSSVRGLQNQFESPLNDERSSAITSYSLDNTIMYQCDNDYYLSEEKITCSNSCAEARSSTVTSRQRSRKSWNSGLSLSRSFISGFPLVPMRYRAWKCHIYIW